MVEHFGDAQGSQGRIVAGEQWAYLNGRRLVQQVSEDGIGVEDGQRDAAREASSDRARCRARSVVGPSPRYLPLSSSTGWSVRGRTTTRSPRSTTITLRAPQRPRASAGMEICPFLDTVMMWLALFTLSIVLNNHYVVWTTSASVLGGLFGQ